MRGWRRIGRRCRSDVALDAIGDAAVDGLIDTGTYREGRGTTYQAQGLEQLGWRHRRDRSLAKCEINTPLDGEKEEFDSAADLSRNACYLGPIRLFADIDCELNPGAEIDDEDV